MHTRETSFLGLSMWGPWGPTEHPDFMTDLTEDHKKIDNVVERISVDTSDLSERVDNLTLTMDNIQEEFVDIKEKVESLYYLEENPAFIALGERVTVCEGLIHDLYYKNETNEAAITDLQQSFTNLSSAVEQLRNDTTSMGANLQAQIDAHGKTIEDHWSHITNLEETVAHILTELTEAKEDIKQLKEVSGQHTSDIAYLKEQQESDDERLTAIELVDSVQNADIDKLKRDSEALTGRVESLESGGSGDPVDPDVLSRITTLESSIGDWSNRDTAVVPAEDITTAIEEQGTSIETLRDSNSTLANKVTELEGADTGLNGRLDELNTKVNAIELEQDSMGARITALEDNGGGGDSTSAREHSVLDCSFTANLMLGNGTTPVGKIGFSVKDNILYINQLEVTTAISAANTNILNGLKYVLLTITTGSISFVRNPNKVTTDEIRAITFADGVNSNYSYDVPFAFESMYQGGSTTHYKIGLIGMCIHFSNSAFVPTGNGNASLTLLTDNTGTFRTTPFIPIGELGSRRYEN